MSHRILATVRVAIRAPASLLRGRTAPSIAASNNLPSSHRRPRGDSLAQFQLRYGCVRSITSTPIAFQGAEKGGEAPTAEGGDAKPPTEQAATEQKDGGNDDDDDECPEWQNPLHHNNPDYTRVLHDEYAPGEEIPSVPLPPFDDGSDSDKVVAPPHLHDLADRIVQLNMIHVKELTDRIGDHFGFVDGGHDSDDEDDDDEGGEEEEKVEEKTAFDLRLTGFDKKAKIKVIKEIRAMTSLGLKEAKDLVEGAPTFVKKGIKKEEAIELMQKLEAIGATVEIV